MAWRRAWRLPQCLCGLLSAPQFSSPGPSFHQSLGTFFSPSFSSDESPSDGPTHAPTTQMGTPSLSSLIHLSIPQLLLLTHSFVLLWKNDCLQTPVTGSQVPIWQKSKAAFRHRYRWCCSFCLPEILSNPAPSVTSVKISLPR